MKTESDTKNKWQATISLILGILSFGLALASFLPILWGRNGGPFGMVIGLGMAFGFLGKNHVNHVQAFS